MENVKVLGMVDRIEADKAVLEMFEPTDWRLILPSAWLPEEREGMVVEFTMKHRPDIERQRRKKMRELQDRLIEKPVDE